MTACRRSSWPRWNSPATGLVLMVVGLVVMAAALPSGWAQQPGPGQPGQVVRAAAGERPTGRSKSCTAGGCHADQTGHKFMHGPAGIGACDTCHEYDDPAKHTFKMKRDEKNLCTFCHVAQEAGRFVHKPVADAQCLGCHDPHGATSKQLLRADNMGKLCESCHGDVTRSRKHVHGPVGAGNCATCHQSHSSDHKHLLVAEGRKLCLGCHQQMGEQMAKVKFIHEPAKGDCLDCHESHASDHMMQLKKDPLTLCNDCHGQVKQAALASSHKHSVVTEGAACINCHTAHGSDLVKLMKDEPVNVCMSCHAEPVKADGKVVAAGVPEIAEGKFKHGPIRDGNCSGCHEVHGSEHSRLLAGNYSKEFYEPFKLDAYALCFNCHNKELVLTAKTEGLTKFRDGEVNLHYLHVNKDQRGRSCRACHSTHASGHPLHIRDSVPYGKWEMPINFEPGRNGGTCSPGCHKPLSYDRVRPVNEITTTQPEQAEGLARPTVTSAGPTTAPDRED